MANNENVGSLQEMINANAEEKLNRDLSKFKEMIISNPLINGDWNNPLNLAVHGAELKKDGSPIYYKFEDLLIANWGVLWKKLYTMNIDIYIQTETEELFAKIAQLRKDVDSLEYNSNQYSED